MPTRTPKQADEPDTTARPCEPARPSSFDRRTVARLALLLGFFALPAILVGVDRASVNSPTDVSSTGGESVAVAGAEKVPESDRSFTGSRTLDFALWGAGIGIVGLTVVAEANGKSTRPADHRLPIS